LVDKVVEDFLDVATPLKQLTDCVVQPPPVGLDRDRIFEDKSENLSNFSDRSVRTAKMVAVGTSTGNKKIAEALLATAGQVTLTSLLRRFCVTGAMFLTLKHN
jgi:vinculin